MNPFDYSFMVRALLAAVFTGFAAPAVGTYLVQRRMALMGDGIGHIAVTGVGLGLLTGQSPVWAAVVVTVLGAVLIELVRERGRTSGDVALALIFYGGIAGGVVVVGLAGGSAQTLENYLFGSITTVSVGDVWTVVGLAAAVIAVSVSFAPQFFAVCQDEEYARVAGLNVRAYSIAISVMAAVSVTVAMRTVGLLMVSALMVVPVATAQQVSRGFKATMAIAMVVGAAASIAGVLTSFYVNVSPGGTIVLLALAVFVATWPVAGLLRYRRERRAPFEAVTRLPHLAVPESHQHEHGADCGHSAVPHGDHIDYVHEGHRHAVHGDHYDEH
ncbi:MAG TPA: metal ABC transporter permease [Nocardioidaceae bacterium]|nr:metal ABC transporter permease [Nocardioidaceae bacterium]